MFKATLIPDSGGAGFVFFNSSRSKAEMNVRLNHQPAFQRVDIPRAKFATQILRQNRRNALTLSVRRDVDLDEREFADAEAALLYCLDAGESIPVIGTLKLELSGSETTATRWAKNTIVPAHSLNEWLGIAPLFEFTFDCGEIVRSNPLIY